jgi:hypothetical protein
MPRPRFKTQAKLAGAIAAAVAGSWLLLAQPHSGGVVAVEIAAYEDAEAKGLHFVVCEDMVSAAGLWAGYDRACFCPTVEFHVHAASGTFAGTPVKAYQATMDMKDRSSPTIAAALVRAFDTDIYGGRFLDPISASDLARKGEVKLCVPKGR